MTKGPWKVRAPPKEPGRCCWVCGKSGGTGFTSALIIAGYRIPPGELGYAHADCMARAKKLAKSRGEPS